MMTSVPRQKLAKPSPTSIRYASERNLEGFSNTIPRLDVKHEMSGHADAPLHPEKRRRLERVAAACDLCKKRKVKCDGEQPCAYCIRKDRAASCIFSGPATRQQVLSAGHTPNTLTHSESAISQRHFRSAGHTPNSRESDRQEDTPQRFRTHEITENGTSVSPTLSRDDHHQGDTVVPVEGRILRDAQGKLIFIGDCAPISSLQTVRHLITSEVDPEASVQATRDPVIEIARPKLVARQQCPSIDVDQVGLLVNEYIAASSGLVQLFQPDDLSEELKSWANSRASSPDDAAAAVFYLVLAIGAQERFEEKAEGWFDHARYLLLQYMCSSMNVSTVQGFTLVAIFMLRASQPNGAYLYFCEQYNNPYRLLLMVHQLWLLVLLMRSAYTGLRSTPPLADPSNSYAIGYGKAFALLIN